MFGEGVSKPCIKLLVLAEEGGRIFLLDEMIGDEGEDGSAVFVGVPLGSTQMDLVTPGERPRSRLGVIFTGVNLSKWLVKFLNCCLFILCLKKRCERQQEKIFEAQNEIALQLFSLLPFLQISLGDPSIISLG